MPEVLNYQEIIEKYPWIVQSNQKCILSPDADGFLSGLLMTSHLNWSVVGFYDGKVLLTKPDTDLSDVVFLDMEILRPHIKSVGHHMNCHNVRVEDDEFEENYNNTINPNHIRGFDRCHNFSQKYPLGTIHLLMFLLEQNGNPVHVHPDGLGAVFFADGAWKILFKYTQNMLDWFRYLGAKPDRGWWKELQSTSVIKLIEEMENLFDGMAAINPEGKRWYGHIKLSDFENHKDLTYEFVKLLSGNLGWEFKAENWDLEGLVKQTLEKKIDTNASGGAGFNRVLDENPISMAMTDAKTIQYTLDPNNIFNEEPTSAVLN